MEQADFREQSPGFCGIAPASQVPKTELLGQPTLLQSSQLSLDVNWPILTAMTWKKNRKGSGSFCTHLSLLHFRATHIFPSKQLKAIWKSWPVDLPPDAESWLIGKDPDAGKDWGQEWRGVTEDEMVDGTINSTDMSLSNSGRQWRMRNLACYSPHGLKELDMTEWLNHNSKHYFFNIGLAKKFVLVFL